MSREELLAKIESVRQKAAQVEAQLVSAVQDSAAKDATISALQADNQNKDGVIAGLQAQLVNATHPADLSDISAAVDGIDQALTAPSA